MAKWNNDYSYETNAYNESEEMFKMMLKLKSAERVCGSVEEAPYADRPASADDLPDLENFSEDNGSAAGGRPSKLSDSDKYRIQKLWEHGKKNQKELAEEYNVSTRTIRRIITDG